MGRNGIGRRGLSDSSLVADEQPYGIKARIGLSSSMPLSYD